MEKIVYSTNIHYILLKVDNAYFKFCVAYPLKRNFRGQWGRMGMRVPEKWWDKHQT